MGETQTMNEITKDNKQTTQESSLEEQTRTMDEITEKNKQTTEESSLEEGNALRKFRKVPPWITTKDKIDAKSTDIVDMVLLRILEKKEKYSYDDFSRILMSRVNVNDMSAGNREPMVVKIGLNKWDPKKLDVMGPYKLKLTSRFFKRANINLEKFLRDNFDNFNYSIEMSKYFYNWSTDTNVDAALMEKFILDGCFIVQLFSTKIDSKEKQYEDEYSVELIQVALSRDLLLLDNQLHFKVLQILFEKSGVSEKLGQPDDGNHLGLIDLAFKFLKSILPTKRLVNMKDMPEPTNLRKLVYEGLRSLSLKHNNFNFIPGNERDKGWISKDGDDKWNLVKSATELEEFGVEFEVIKTDKFTDIKFTDKAVLEIPSIRIRYGIAFSINMLLEEENDFFCHIENSDKPRWLSDYLWFMNNLLKSPSDVQLLRQKNIIDNLSELLDDAAILKFLKDTYASLMISPHNFSYWGICKNLNSHCINHRPNFWLAKLKRDYFNSPWAIISLFAASLLIILTIVQTIFSVASYYKDQGRF